MMPPTNSSRKTPTPDQKLQPKLELEHAKTHTVDRFEFFADLASVRSGRCAVIPHAVDDQVTGTT
jgi:hypothetical protein